MRPVFKKLINSYIKENEGNSLNIYVTIVKYHYYRKIFNDKYITFVEN